MSVLSKERLDNSVLDNAISTYKTVVEVAGDIIDEDYSPVLDKVTLAFLEELKQYRNLEEQGLLLRLPCKVGGTVWVSDRDGKPREMILDEPDIRCHCAKEDNLCMALCDRKNTGVCAYRFKNDGSDIGEKVFLTKSEAEEKLRELEGK